MISTIRQPIVFDGTSTPVKTALFLIICVAWILAGLIGHDPWNPEAAVVSVVNSMLRDGNWLLPRVAGSLHYEYPPLYYWTAAILAKVLSPFLPLHDAARLASGLFVAIALTYTHKTATRLYDARAGRISVLLLIGCLGMLVRGHEINPELAGFAGLAVATYGLTRIRSEPRKGGVTTGLGAGIIALSVGAIAALAPVLTAIGIMALLNEWKNRTFLRGIGVATGVSILFMLAYPVALVASGQDIQPWMNAILGTPLDGATPRRTMEVTYFLSILPWYGLPALPFALWLWWKDRTRLHERIELALPLVAFVVVLLILSFARKANDAVALALLIPLALAAANTPDRLPRGLASFMDWFGLVFFGVLVFLLWTLWAAALTGIPRNFARWAAREAPGFDPQFAWIPFLIALALSLIWLYAVARAHRNNRRAIVNWAAGITIFWVLLNLFGLPAVDHVRSYRSTAKIIATKMPMPPTGCIASLQLGDAQRAAFDYFAGLRFVDTLQPAAAQCSWLLTQGTRTSTPAIESTWRMVWEGARPGDSVERLRLYERVPPIVN